MRLPGRRLEEWTTTTSRPRPSSRRTSSAERRGERGTKKLWMTSIEPPKSSTRSVSRFRDCGHRGDRVRARQGVPDGRRVAGIVAEQRRVRAVQRRDHGRLLFAREHRAGEDGCRRVRHGIVHVKQVQPMIPAHLGHAHRQRQGVVGKSEHLVVVDDDGMEVQPRPIREQAKRPLVTDEMHLVSPARQILSERGGQGAAPPHGGKAADADTERVAASHVSHDARGARPSPAVGQAGSSVQASSDRSISSRPTKVMSGASSCLR